MMSIPISASHPESVAPTAEMFFAITFAGSRKSTKTFPAHAGVIHPHQSRKIEF
jgi:hypothetical protein